MISHQGDKPSGWQALAERSSVNLDYGLSAAVTCLTKDFAIGVAALRGSAEVRAATHQGQPRGRPPPECAVSRLVLKSLPAALVQSGILTWDDSKAVSSTDVMAVYSGAAVIGWAAAPSKDSKWAIWAPCSMMRWKRELHLPLLVGLLASAVCTNQPQSLFRAGLRLLDVACVGPKLSQQACYGKEPSSWGPIQCRQVLACHTYMLCELLAVACISVCASEHGLSAVPQSVACHREPHKAY